MRIVTNLDAFRPVPARPLFTAIGNFDGLHLGHRALLGRILENARAARGIAAAFTFREHPQAVLHPAAHPRLLTSAAHKLFLFEELGLDLCFMMPFTREFSKLEPAQFVEEILVKRLGVREVSLGHNARFGHDRKGDARLMEKLSKEFGFSFFEMPPVLAGGAEVSSSRIRKLVESGELEKARECLGRPFGIFAKVTAGEGRGKGLGYPTANLATEEETLPPEGVYPVSLRVLDLPDLSSSGVTGGSAGPAGRPPLLSPADASSEFKAAPTSSWLKGVLNYGSRPTFGAGRPAAEVFILDYEGDLYGRTVEVLFHSRLRGEKKFASPEALKEQIRHDIARARDDFDQNPLF